VERTLQELSGAEGVEILLVGGASKSQPSSGPAAGMIRTMQHKGLVPELWGAGISESLGRYIALTTAEFVLDGAWLTTAKTVAAANEWPAVGGAIDGPSAGNAVDWAVYFVRYSAFMPPVVEDAKVAEIAGDNAIYRRRELDDYWGERERGFWEVSFHRSIRNKGMMPRMSSALTARFAGGVAPSEFARARFHHGRHYGATREIGEGERILRALTAPALIPLLWWRIARRVLSKRRDLALKLVAASFWIAVFLCAWTAGEALGYLSRRQT
jgi:hypothetical protein